MQAAHPVWNMGVCNHAQAANRTQTFRQRGNVEHYDRLTVLGMVQHCQDFLPGLVGAAKLDSTQP